MAANTPKQPNIEPNEAIAIALSICLGREVRPEGKMVEMILRSLRESRWAIVPASEAR
jgi:hypothetical protein